MYSTGVKPGIKRIDGRRPRKKGGQEGESVDRSTD